MYPFNDPDGVFVGNLEAEEVLAGGAELIEDEDDSFGGLGGMGGGGACLGEAPWD